MPWNARLLAATNRNLEEAVTKGEFREDLFYRISVVPVRLPPLRQRIEDLPALVGEILMLTNRRFRRRLLGVTPEAMAALSAYAWPGNVRELRNIIERAFVLETSDRITVAALPFGPTALAPTPLAPAPTEPLPILPLTEYVARQEREYIRLVLDQCGGNVTQAARALHLDRFALHKKMRSLGVKLGTGRDQDGD